MRKNATKLAALALTLAMTVTSVALPSSASAATKTVKLNTTSKTLYATGSSAKKTTTLKVTVNGKKKTATFKSSNTKVATVGKTSGKVTAKKAGKATITATYGGKKVTCKITVKAKFVKVTSVSVSPKTVSLAVGKTKTIKTTVKPSNASIKKVTYASSNKSVATVTSAGKITAKKAGTAKVTVTATDGTKKKTTVTVKVTKATTPTATPDATTTPTPTETPAATATSASASSIAVKEFKATKASVFTATFEGKVPETAKLTVYKGTATTQIKEIKWNADRTEATLTSDINFTEGTYTLKVVDGDKESKAEAVVTAEKVDKIVITSKQALLKPVTGNNKKDTAFIYYDVFNQYGESIRANKDITWTVSSCTNPVVDRTTGKITAKKNDGNDYVYGSEIFLTGVYAKTGVMVSGSVKVGMEQMINTVKFAGFVNKNEKTKILETLPKDFAKDTYSILYQTCDQDGNIIDAANGNIAASNLTFLSDNALLMSPEIKDDETVYTINGEEYCAAKVNPGNYVDKGGEVKITAISNKTGQKTEQVFKIGAAKLLKSVKLSAPADTVADGDSVEIPFEAYDTAGNKVTDYETIVRSTNSLNLNASEGTLSVVEKNDGSAKIVWTDNATDHPVGTADSFTKRSSYDGVPRSISLSTVVVGGEADNMMLSVSDTRRPFAIKEFKLGEDGNNTLASGTPGFTKKIAEDFAYYDQYGKEITNKEIVKAFFETAKVGGAGFDGEYYGIKVDTKSGNVMGVTPEVAADGNADTITFTPSLGTATVLASGSATQKAKYDELVASKAAKAAAYAEKKQVVVDLLTANGGGSLGNDDKANYTTSYSAAASALTSVDGAAAKVTAAQNACKDAIVATEAVALFLAAGADSTFEDTSNTTYLAESFTAAGVTNASSSDAAFTTTSVTVGDATQASVKYSIAKIKKSDYSAQTTTLENWNDDSKLYSVNYNVVPVAKLQNIAIGDIKKQQIKTDKSDKECYNSDDVTGNVTGDAEGTLEFVNPAEVKVYGSYQGAKVQIPADYTTIDETNIAMNGNKFANVVATKLKWADLYDKTSAKGTRKDASLPVKVSVFEDTGKAVLKDTPQKNITISDAEAYPVSIELRKDGKKQDTLTVNPTGLNLAETKYNAITLPTPVDILDGTAHKNECKAHYHYYVKDQYGNAMDHDTQANTTSGTNDTGKYYLNYTLSNVKESTGVYTHVLNSLAVNKNSSNAANLTGAEITDTFDLTATVVFNGKVTNVSVKTPTTVGADTMANVSSNGNSDKELRKLLKYDR